MPYKLKKLKNGRFIVYEMVGNRSIIRANKPNRKEALEWIESEG